MPAPLEFIEFRRNDSTEDEVADENTFCLVLIIVIAAFAPFAVYHRVRSITNEKLVQAVHAAAEGEFGHLAARLRSANNRNLVFVSRLWNEMRSVLCVYSEEVASHSPGLRAERATLGQGGQMAPNPNGVPSHLVFK
jgi:hypothetical protein